jgi:hypothetical protein
MGPEGPRSFIGGTDGETACDDLFWASLVQIAAQVPQSRDRRLARC